MIGTMWIIKGSIPFWRFNEVGYIIKIARIEMGSIIMITKGLRGDSPLVHIIWNGIEGCVFNSDLESHCIRIY